jgi:hypothetical protein
MEQQPHAGSNRAGIIILIVFGLVLVATVVLTSL